MSKFFGGVAAATARRPWPVLIIAVILSVVVVVASAATIVQVVRIGDSGARATWQLDGAYTAFEATVAIDDTAPAQASARVRVLIDGREAWASPELTAQAGPLHLPRIPLNGAEELTLTVDYGRSGDMGDRINWIDPVLIRQN